MEKNCKCLFVFSPFLSIRTMKLHWFGSPLNVSLTRLLKARKKGDGEETKWLRGSNADSYCLAFRTDESLSSTVKVGPWLMAELCLPGSSLNFAFLAHG